MSIRKISDLPNVKSVDYSLSNLKDSLIEVSYKPNPNKSQYVSRYMVFDDVVSAISASLKEALEETIKTIVIKEVFDVDGILITTEQNQ